MSRQDEIDQGLREEGGSLIGGLNALDYVKGIEDFAAGISPPSFTSTSYDLGRRRASENAAAAAEVRAGIDRRSREGRERVRQLLAEANRPDVLADYDAKMAEIDARRS